MVCLAGSGNSASWDCSFHDSVHGWAQAAPAPPAQTADTMTTAVRELQEEVRELRNAVVELRSEAGQYRAETEQLRRELQASRSSSAVPEAATVRCRGSGGG